MADAGLSYVEALHATTSSAADLLGVSDQLGTLEPGKVADLVVVDGSPDDLLDLRVRVRAVYQAGRLVSEGVALT